MLFPLLTVPYVTRALCADNYGKVSFSRAFVSWFILLAGLGISNYAVREGAKMRNDRKKLSKFVSEIFSINFYMTIISYAVMFCVVLFPKFSEYRIYILVLSLENLMHTLGVEWVCSVYEDFRYFTIRTLIVRTATLLAILCLVKTPADTLKYCCIIAGSYTFSNVLNFIHSRKYVDLRLTLQINLKKHLLPILIMFGNTVMTTIYVSSDKVLLGLMANDYSVGIYSVSSQAYSIVKTVINAMTIVTLARLSYFIGSDEKEKYDSLFEKTLNSTVFIICPAVVGLFCTAKEVIWFLGGTGYMDAVFSLKTLSIALLFAAINTLMTSDVLIPYGQEKTVLICSACSALLNIILNLFLIPRYTYNAAAVTTLIAEIFAFVMIVYYSKDFAKIRLEPGGAVQILIGVMIIVIICASADMISMSMLARLVCKIVFSVLAYSAVMLLMKNKMVMYFKRFALKKLYSVVTHEKTRL